MIASFSASSPQASVALFDDDGALVGRSDQPAERRASGALIHMLQSLLGPRGVGVGSLTFVVVDIGPGSFSGTRVGVTIAKTVGFALEVQVAGVASFDLIDPNRSVAVPCGKGEFLVRTEDGAIEKRRDVADTIGYGFGGIDVYPDAARVGPILNRLLRISPEALLPGYVLEPSITESKRSIANRAFGSEGG